MNMSAMKARLTIVLITKQNVQLRLHEGHFVGRDCGREEEEQNHDDVPFLAPVCTWDR